MTWAPEKQREWRALNRERLQERERARYLNNGDQIRERQRAYYAANREMMRERERARYVRNREAIIKRNSKYYTQNRERLLAEGWARRLRDHHGLQPEEWAAMLDAQDGRCYLCGDQMILETEKIVIDHDHSCCRRHRSCPICRRGLAHDQCNITIGKVGDDPARMRRMADGLEAAQLAFRQRRAVSGAGEQLTLSG